MNLLNIILFMNNDLTIDHFVRTSRFRPPSLRLGVSLYVLTSSHRFFRCRQSGREEEKKKAEEEQTSKRAQVVFFYEKHFPLRRVKAPSSRTAKENRLQVGLKPAGAAG